MAGIPGEGESVVVTVLPLTVTSVEMGAKVMTALVDIVERGITIVQGSQHSKVGLGSFTL